MDYLKLIVAFIAGGGVQFLIKHLTGRKFNKLSYAEQAVNFWEKYSSDIQGKYEAVLQRVAVFESKVEELERLKCQKIECKQRI